MTFDDEDLKIMVSKSIMEYLGPEKRDELLTKTLKSLMTTTRSYEPTELEKIFIREATNLSQEIIKTALGESLEFKKAVKDLFIKSAAAIFLNESEENLRWSFSTAFEHSMEKTFRGKLEEIKQNTDDE